MLGSTVSGCCFMPKCHISRVDCRLFKSIVVFNFSGKLIHFRFFLMVELIGPSEMRVRVFGRLSHACIHNILQERIFYLHVWEVDGVKALNVKVELFGEFLENRGCLHIQEIHGYLW